MARVRRALAAALAWLALSAPSVVRADDDTVRAEQAFHDGNRAFAAGDFHAAFDAYRTAWSLKQTFDIACNLGRTEVELSLSRDAAEHLDYCLRTFSVSSRGDVRDANKRFSELFQRVRREVDALTLEVRPVGAEITVDGASYGIAPLGRPIFLMPGPHLVKARLAGYLDEERSVTAEAGGSLNVTFALTQASSPGVGAVAPGPVAAARAVQTPPPAATPPRAPAATGTEPRTVVLIAGTAASVLALGLGVGFMLEAGSAHDDASRLGASLHQTSGTECGVGAGGQCASLKTAVDRERQNRDRADAALLTGALVGVATLGAWLAIPDLVRSEVGSVRATPWAAPGGSGVAFVGSY